MLRCEAWVCIPCLPVSAASMVGRFKRLTLCAEEDTVVTLPQWRLGGALRAPAAGLYFTPVLSMPCLHEVVVRCPAGFLANDYPYTEQQGPGRDGTRLAVVCAESISLWSADGRPPGQLRRRVAWSPGAVTLGSVLHYLSKVSPLSFFQPENSLLHCALVTQAGRQPVAMLQSAGGALLGHEKP